MYHIVFNSDENYIKYNAVLITNIVKFTESAKSKARFYRISHVIFIIYKLSEFRIF